jgi:hypothetical protein
MTLLANLRAEGLHLEARGAGKLHVQPREALTPARRQAILAHKPALLAALGLEARIRAMAVRWDYAPAELVWALNAAAAEPAVWLDCVVADEESAAKQKRAGLELPS